MANSLAGSPPIIRRVAIIGGGFSGALQAINLLRHDGPAATLIERRPEVGRGVAYSAADPALLLNVRAANMSALPDEPGHFSAWLERRGLAADGFVPRVIYGEYLAGLLQAAQAQAPDRLTIVHDDAIGADVATGQVNVALASGTRIEADALVLAMGNLPPALPDHCDPRELPTGAYAPDPWSPAVAEELRQTDEVLVVGTGLTMIDAALLLDRRGFRGRIVALSRRGLVPRPHGDSRSSGGLGTRPPLALTNLLQAVRTRSADLGWRAAVDELRPHTRGMWLAASPEQKARFLRHLRPWWDVHRHRIAGPVATQIERMRAEGRLHVVAGRTLGFADAGGGFVDVRWRRRGAVTGETVRVRRVINCSGPGIDISRTNEPLLRQLYAAGVIVADPLGLGLSVDRDARLISASGAVSGNLFALGPMTRGSFWEITAVPDIRVQTWDLARRLSNAHWVGGEGL